MSNTKRQNLTIEQLTEELERMEEFIEDLEDATNSDGFLDIVRIAHSVDPDATEYHLHKLGLGHMIAELRVVREVAIQASSSVMSRQTHLPFGG